MTHLPEYSLDTGEFTLPDPPPTRGQRIARIVGRSVFGVVAGVLVIALIAAGVVAFTVQRSFPQLDGDIALPGLLAETTVQRDELGIPVITAENAHDLFYAQGFVHAQDRFWEMDFRRHVTSGRLSELFGESQVETDVFLRTLGWHHIAAQEVEALDPVVRDYYEAYAEGVNAYLDDRDAADVSLEYSVLGLQNADYEIEPWTAVDSVAWLKAMAWDLRSNIGDEIDRALLAQDHTPAEIAAFYPPYPEDHPVIAPTEPTPTPAPVATPAPDATPAPGETPAPDATPAPGETPAADAAPEGAGGSAETAVAASVDWSAIDRLMTSASAPPVEGLGEALGDVGEGIGSNSWVVSGRFTESGQPLLANDPHLGGSLPSVWHQVGLRCAEVSEECPFEVSGFGFSGVPGVIIGHNAKVAWGFTNLTSDVTDLYIERVSGDQYLRDGALVPLEIRPETITVAGGDDIEIEVRSTVHGPILPGSPYDEIAADPYIGTGVDETLAAANAPIEGEYAVSLRWTALEVGNAASSIFALDRAQNWDEFRAAAALFDVPAQNLVYADVEGNIGYQTPGKLPIRREGDGSVPLPGWSSGYDWHGYIPFDQLPTRLNPEEGFIVTANNAVVDDEYPYVLTRDWDYGWRAARITELLEREIAAGQVDAETMHAIQSDDQFWMGKRLAAVLVDENVAAEVDDRTAEALDLLTLWDAQNSADSAAAAFANVFWRTLVQEVVVENDPSMPLGDQGRLFAVFDQLLDDPESPWWTNADAGVSGRSEMLAHVAEIATEELVRLQGDTPSRWTWGALHTITLRSDSFGTSGIAPIEWLFNRGPEPVSGGSSVVNANGWSLESDGYEVVTVPSMRMVVDLDDLDASTWNHLTGASGHAFHQNYTDQFELWRAKQATPWAFSADAVDAATTHTLVLRPAK